MYDRNYDSKAKFEDLQGKTITEISGLEKGSEEAFFTTSDGKKYRMVYFQDCCASCSIEEIHGDTEDLLNTEILLAEEVQNMDDPAEYLERVEKEKAEAEANGSYYYGDDSHTWTFYKLATIKGSVTIRWYGSSNGYYSESASFEECAF